MRNPKNLKSEGKASAEPGGTLIKAEVEIDKSGHLPLPPEILTQLGAGPGTRLRVVKENGQIRIEPNLHALRRLYLEPTSACNLACQTCIRHTWSEPSGSISLELVEKLATGLKSFPFL
jgi:antitoxin component of MazEF toxin-antitoxin module